MISYDDIKSGRAAVPAEKAPEVRDYDLDLSEIRLDQSAQPREALNNDRIAEYADAMKAGDQFPPLTVFHDGSTYWLADGFHRHYAAQHAGRKHIRCHVRQGGLRDAILWSVGANAKHGLARSDEDKKRAVMRLLEDAEWSQWSDREIARRCRVSDKTVAKYRPAVSADDPQIERKVQRGGTIYTQKVAKAAKKNAPEGPQLNDEPSPEVGPQAEASPVGTDTGTPADREGRHEGEAASVGLPTSPRNIVAEVCELWNLATEAEREEIRVIINTSVESRERQTAIEVSKPEATPKERSLPSVGPSGTAAADAAKAETMAGSASATVSPSAAISADTAPAAPRPNPAGAVPLSPGPQNPEVDDGQPYQSANVPPAQKTADVAPTAGQDGYRADHSSGEFAQQSAGDPQDGNETVSGEPASVTNSKPDCLKLKDGHCKLSFSTSALCAECNAERMKRRAA